jgi:hypothetical protein
MPAKPAEFGLYLPASVWLAIRRELIPANDPVAPP